VNSAAEVTMVDTEKAKYHGSRATKWRTTVNTVQVAGKKETRKGIAIAANAEKVRL